MDKQIIMVRPYKNQRQKDLELCKAYQMGLIDGRKEEKEKFSKLNLIERKKEFCFCMGDAIWRPICSECKDYLKSHLEKIKEELKLFLNNYGSGGLTFEDIDKMFAKDEEGVK